MSLRLVSPQNLVSTLLPFRSILCVVARENGQLGTAVSDQYLGSASPLLNTTRFQDIEEWIKERKVGGIVFALPQLSAAVSSASASASASAPMDAPHNQSPGDLLSLRQTRQALVEHSWQEDSTQPLTACLMDHQLPAEEAFEVAKQEAEKGEYVNPHDPCASTDAVVALNHFLWTQSGSSLDAA